MIGTVLFLLSSVLCLVHKDVSTITPSCTNKKNVISCCLDVDEEISIFELDLDFCADLTIDWKKGGVELDLMVNDTVLFDTSFSLNHAPEICGEIYGIEICAALSNLEFDNWNFSGCLDLELIKDDVKKDITIGCWDTSRRK